jgi:hypothetical protein
MERAIRHSDGTMITSSEWAAIRATARMIKMDLLSLPPSRDRLAKNRTRSKTYFRTYFRKEWDAAVAKMESVLPLLALCASHWKAEHVLGNTLLVKSATGSDEDGSDSAAEDDNKSPKRKRRTKDHSDERKRKKMMDISGPQSGEANVAFNSNEVEASSTVEGASNGEVGGSRNSPGSTEIEGEGNNADATRRRIQVLTKDELKDLLKASNMAVAWITKRTKGGEFLHVMLHKWR